MGLKISIVVYYISFFICLYGGIWMFRRMPKRLRSRKRLRKLRQSLKDRPINYGQMEGRVKRK